MKLSDGEKLTLLRRRKGHSQAFEARTYNVTQALYSMWETDKVPFKKAPIARVVPTKYEKCFIERRRLGLTQLKLSELMGVPVAAIIACELSEPLPALSAHKYWTALQSFEKRE